MDKIRPTGPQPLPFTPRRRGGLDGTVKHRDRRHPDRHVLNHVRAPMTPLRALACAALLAGAPAALVLPAADARIAAGVLDPRLNSTLWAVNSADGLSARVVRVATDTWARTGELPLGAAIPGNVTCAWVDPARRLAYFVASSAETSLVRVNLDSLLSDEVSDWSFSSIPEASRITRCLFDSFGRNVVYLGSSSTPGAPRLLRVNLDNWGAVTGPAGGSVYTPGWITLSTGLGADMTAMAMDRTQVFIGQKTTPGSVIVTLITGLALTRDTVWLNTGGCAATTCLSPSAGVYHAPSSSSFWATSGTEGLSIVRISHPDNTVLRWEFARDHLAALPGFGVLAAGWAFFLANTGGTGPATILRVALPDFSQPSNLTLQHGTGAVAEVVVDNSTSREEPGWLYAAYGASAPETTPAVGMIANVAAWRRSSSASTMSESISATPSYSPTPSNSPTPSAAVTPTPVRGMVGITTLAGTGAPGDGGDGGPASNASLSGPAGVTRDASGNVLIADTANHRIRRVTAAGTIDTLAGSGALGESGDGGPAADAQLNGPRAVAVDPSGNVFIADSGNSRIRVVAVGTGVITMFAGWDGFGSAAANPGPANRTSLSNPQGVAVDALGNVFIADSGNNRVRKVAVGSGICTVIAGSIVGFSGDGALATVARLSSPTGVAVDSNGDIFIADSENHRIRKVAASTGIITTVAGSSSGGAYAGDGGPATSARLSSPTGVAVDASGNLVIADKGNNRLRAVLASGGIATYAGSGSATSSGDGGPPTAAGINGPNGVAFDAGGAVVVAEMDGHRIRRVNDTAVFSASATSLATITTSSTGSASSSATVGASPTGSSTISSTVSATSSGSGTVTAPSTLTPSSTITRSSTASSSSSVTAPASPTGTVTASSTISTTASGAPTSSTTATPSPAATASATGTQSRTSSGSSTITPSPTSTSTRSAGSTASATGTRSPTASGATPTTSPSRSISRSLTSSRSPTRTPTTSGSATVTPSATPPATPSSSGSATSTLTSTGTVVSPTASLSMGATPSATRSPSLSSSTTPSATMVPSTSATASLSATPSVLPVALLAVAALRWDGSGPVERRTPSSRPTPSSAAGSSATADGTSSGSGIGARVSSSPAGRRRALSEPADAAAAALPLTLMVSEAWLPTPFLVTASVAPGVGENVTVVCESANEALGLVISPRHGYNLTDSSPLQLRFNITAPFTADTTLVDVEPDSYSDIECRASSVGVGPVARRHFASTLPVGLRASVLRARWPLVQDAIVFKARNGQARSLFGSEFVDVWPALFAGCGNDTELCPESDMEAALELPGAVEHALAASGLLPDAARLRNASRSRPFDMKLSGATHVTFVADETFWYRSGTAARRVFSKEHTSVTVGGVACDVRWVSPDGRLLHVVTPPFTSVCQESGEDCGFQPLAITAGARAFGDRDAVAGLSSFDGVWLDANNSGNPVAPPPLSLAGSVSCPPFCPGSTAIDPGAAPVVVAMSVGGGARITVVPGRVDAATGVLVPLPPRLDEAPPPRGIFFSETCVGDYIHDMAVCSDWDNPAPARCAYGAGDACQNCPVGAICPGGFRALVKRGYYVPAPNRLPVTRCPVPAEERCLGWNATANAVQCGVGYRPGSYQCQACAKGFYVASDGSCDECPSLRLASLLLPLISFLASLLAFGLVNYLLIVSIAKYSGGSVAGGAAAALQLMVWTFTVIQTIVQVGKAASPGLPGFLRQAYAGLDVFSFGGLSPNTACLAGAYPFLNEAAQMSLALGCLLLVVALQPSYRKLLSLRRLKELQRDASRGALARAGDSVKPLLRRALFTALTLMYPIVMLSAMDMLSCASSVITVRVYLSMDQDGSSLARIGRALPVSAATGAPMGIEELVQRADDASVGGSNAVGKLLNAPLPVSLLVSNGLFVCREGAHASVWALAWATLLLYGIGYPLGTFVWVCVRINRVLAQHRAAAAAEGRSDQTEGHRFCVPQLSWLPCGMASSPTAGPLAPVRAMLSRRGPDSGALALARPTLLEVPAGDGAVAELGPALAAPRSGWSLSLPSISPRLGSLRSFSLSPGGHGKALDGSGRLREFSVANPLSKRDAGPASAGSDPGGVDGGDVLPAQGAFVTGRGGGAGTGDAAFATAAAAAVATSSIVSPAQTELLAAVSRRRACCWRPAVDAARAASEASSRLDPVSRLLDGHPALLTDNPALSHFTGQDGADYRPSAFYFRQLDLALLFVLSALLVFWRRPPDNAAVYAKMALSIAALSGLVLALLRVRPFRPNEAWKHWVRVYALGLSVFAAVLNGFTTLTGFEGAWQAVLRAGITGLSYLVAALSLGLFVMLLAGFWHSLVAQGRAEAEVAAAAAAAAAAASRGGGGGGGGGGKSDSDEAEAAARSDDGSNRSVGDGRVGEDDPAPAAGSSEAAGGGRRQRRRGSSSVSVGATSPARPEQATEPAGNKRAPSSGRLVSMRAFGVRAVRRGGGEGGQPGA